MKTLSFSGVFPTISEGVFIAPGALVIGHVLLNKDVNIWHNAVIRGDVDKITIGAGTNIQDLSVLHVVEKMPLIIGNGVSVGHKAILHACTIGDHCLIGMGSIVLDGAVIGENSVVAAGAVVPPGKIYPANSMIMGSPAKVKRELTDDEKRNYGEHYLSYISLKNKYLLES